MAATTSKVNLASITTKILTLKPLPIDVTKCTPNKSLYHQILNNRQSTSERQAKQFNLGNTHCTANPIDAADFVLEREYGESSLYVQGEHSSVFIPPTFVSNQYKKYSTAILDYDIKKDIGRLLDNSKQNSPMNWFTRELEAFMSTQHGGESIDAKDFQRWTLNLQIIYLAIVELKTDQTTLPSTTSDLRVFIQSVIAALPSPSALKTLLCKNLSAKILRKQIKQMVENNSTEDSNLQWLFGLELSDTGEKMEHWFYNQLVALKDDTLRDTVALSSLTFMTNLKSKMHKEIDFLIISWQRKLIISVELKRTVADEKVFEQLESNHRIFEERLGDQLKSGWTYFPVVCVEKDALSVNSQHYVTMETEIKAWLISIFNKFPIVQTTPTSNPLDEVKDLLKILVFAIHVSKKDQVAPITTSRWVEYTSNAIENVSTSHNIIFYSSQQLAIMNNDDPSHKKVMVRRPFGVGKSILLMQKAIQLNTQSEYNGKVMCIVGVEIRATNEWNELMLANRLKMELEEDRGIFVETFDLLSNYTTLLGKVKSRDIKAIFIDECNVWKQAIKWMEEVMPLVDYQWSISRGISGILEML
ncbi:uncharacterized protein [Clytia hemisphaerica]|uniref:Uncharacterized protein n=1 Tax=Clytia hemisphaerica TaxID=252671 RepID=A0A7M5UZQ8_9CNID